MWVDIPYIDPTGFACTIACWWKTNHADVLGKHQGATLTGNITPFQTNCFTKHFWTINQYGFRENICLLPKSPAKKSVPLQVFFSCFNAKKGSQQKSSPPSSPKKKQGGHQANHHGHPSAAFFSTGSVNLPGDDLAVAMRRFQISGRGKSMATTWAPKAWVNAPGWCDRTWNLNGHPVTISWLAINWMMKQFFT